MENVMWFLEDENNNIIEQILLPVNAEKQAINEFTARLSAKGVDGQFKIGYISTTGEKFINSKPVIFGNSELIKAAESYKKEGSADF